MDREQSEKSAAPRGVGEYALKRNHKLSALMALVAVLVAILVWIVVMNVPTTAVVRVEIPAVPEGYEAELSAGEVELRGTRAALRRAEAVRVTVESVAPDEAHVLGEGELILPAGTTLVSDEPITLTVRAK